MTVIAIPKILREKLGDAGADALVTLFNSPAGEMIEGEIVEVKSDFAVKIGQLRTEIAQTKAEIIRWMFIFWVGQIGVLTAILFAFFRR